MYDICIECIHISTSIFLVSKEPHKTYTKHDHIFSLFNKRIAGGGIVPKVDDWVDDQSQIQERQIWVENHLKPSVFFLKVFPKD